MAKGFAQPLGFAKIQLILSLRYGRVGRPRGVDAPGFSGGSMIDELYDLIGGKQTIWAATQAFYRRVLADDTLSLFFKSTDMAQLRARQSMFISMLLGGRIVYTGKDIAAAHAHAREQGLNDAHFDRFLKHFREALNEVGVQADKVDRVTKLLESKRSAVLNP
jgi:hemoglobin